MKTWKRIAYRDADGGLYVSNLDYKKREGDDFLVRIIGELYYRKMLREHRNRQRVFDAAMKLHSIDHMTDEHEVPRLMEALSKACEKARASTVKKKRK